MRTSIYYSPSDEEILLLYVKKNKTIFETARSKTREVKLIRINDGEMLIVDDEIIINLLNGFKYELIGFTDI